MNERLADRIARQIAEHIRSEKMAEGDHLAAQALADRFRVSRAPVTAALKALAADGVVEAQPNRGFFVKAMPPAEPETTGDEDPLYSAIVEARLSGELPDRTSENEMMRRFGATRARLQRVLAQIAEEGWAERLPGHGWLFLATLHSTAAYEQSYRFRATIETEALLQPGYRFEPAELEQLRSEQQGLLQGGISKLPRAGLFEMNAGFHETLVAWSGNRFFLDAIKRVNRLRRLIEFRVTADRSRLEQQCREHLALLDLIERGDMLLAADFVRRHIGQALEQKADALE
jgi:DNA-binding GntR family transcriptional regulator